jgi:hypothetical protein
MKVQELWRLAAPAVLVFAAACGSDDNGPPAPGGAAGSLSVQVTGLAPGSNAAVTVTGPGGYSESVVASETLTGLDVGTYTATAAPVANAGFSYQVASPVTATVTDGGTATASLTYAIKTLPRSTANRPDGGVINKYRVMYVLPSDGVDRNLDTDGTIIRTVSSIQRWFAGQTGGRHLRLDMSDDALDITFARIGRTDAAMTSYGDFIRDTLEKELVAGGYSSPSTLLLVYYDGGHQSRCGSAATPPALVGPVGAIFLKGLASSSFPCANNPFAATPWAPPTYIEFTAAHEALHLLGIVSAGAPDFNNYHVDNDPTDLMYAGALPWRPATLDVTKTNYYNSTSLPGGIVNFSSSAYLTP